ncbi:hypothetical protein FI667_g3524, partial [Globisporangium splendens]
MPQKSAHAPTKVVNAMLDTNAVLRALEENQGLHIYATPIDPLSLTLDIFTVESLRAAHVTPPSSEGLKCQVPHYSRKCTWLGLLQLREDLQKIVHSASNLQQQRCAKCQEMEEYLEHCFERPAMFSRTWNGEMIVKTKVVEHFMNALVAFVGSLQESVPVAGDDCHQQVVRELLIFQFDKRYKATCLSSAQHQSFPPFNMLRRSAHTPASVAVVRSSATVDANVILRALEENQGLRIHATSCGSNDSLSVTLDVFTVESLRGTHITPSSPDSENPQATHYSRKCTWPKLRQLREDLQRVVQTTSNLQQQRCAKCQEMEEYLEHCFERPTMFSRTWNGEMIVKTKVVEHFMNALVAFVSSFQECTPSSCDDYHRQVVGCVSSFLVPTSKCD